MIIQKLSDTTMFSSTENEVALYIQKHRHTVCKMSIHDLAKETYSSTSTILRLCKKIGFEGFSDFKMALNSELSKTENKATIDNLDFPFQQDDTYENIVDNIFKLYITSITEAIENFDLENMRMITNHLYNASIIDIYGQGSSRASADEFKEKMQRLGKTICIEAGYTEQIHQAINSDHTHYAIVISHSGNNLENLKIINILKKKQIPMLGITNNKDTYLARAAQDNIYTEVSEARSLISKIETFGSNVAVQFILDCLYSFLFHLNYRDNLLHTKSNEDELRKSLME